MVSTVAMTHKSIVYVSSLFIQYVVIRNGSYDYLNVLYIQLYVLMSRPTGCFSSICLLSLGHLNRKKPENPLEHMKLKRHFPQELVGTKRREEENNYWTHIPQVNTNVALLDVDMSNGNHLPIAFLFK